MNINDLKEAIYKAGYSVEPEPCEGRVCMSFSSKEPAVRAGARIALALMEIPEHLSYQTDGAEIAAHYAVGRVLAEAFANLRIYEIYSGVPTFAHYVIVFPDVEWE